MRRLLVAALALLALSGCNKKQREVPKPTRASVGQACAAESKLTCLSASEAIVCVDGKYETMPCRDTECSGGPMGDICSNKTFLPGEYCSVHSAVDDFWKHDCSVDGKSQLQCVGKHWQLEKKCPGKLGCRRVEKLVGSRGGWRSILSCDESVTDEGAACTPEDRYACTGDFKGTVRCTGGRWRGDQRCRGPAGCKQVGDKATCDDTLSGVGQGATYYLTLAAADGGEFLAHCIRDGGSYGFEAGSVFADGWAEFDRGDGLGWLGWYGWNSAASADYKDADLQLHFETLGAGG